MKNINIRKAQTIVETESVEIRIEQPIQCSDELKLAAIEFDRDAKLLCDTLIDSLPGGTFDRLLAYMLEEKVSHFRVSYS